MMFMLSKNMTKREKGNLPCTFNNAIAIRNTMLGDEQQLLAFYLSLSDDDKWFFKPWAFTNEAIANHIQDAYQGWSISMVAVNSEKNIVGHAFVVNVKPRAWPRDTIKNIYRLAKRSFVVYALSPKPRLGIGLQRSVQGCGLGEAMMYLILEECKRLHMPKVSLGVHKANKRARSLYEKMGFIVVRELSQQEKNDSFEMEKQILINAQQT